MYEGSKGSMCILGFRLNSFGEIDSLTRWRWPKTIYIYFLIENPDSLTQIFMAI